MGRGQARRLGAALRGHRPVGPLRGAVGRADGGDSVDRPAPGRDPRPIAPALAVPARTMQAALRLGPGPAPGRLFGTGRAGAGGGADMPAPLSGEVRAERLDPGLPATASDR